MKAKLLISRILLVILMLAPVAARSEVNFSLKGSYRSDPAGQNVQATAAYEGLLWGEVDKEMPLYGYYRLGASAGGTPTAAAFVEVAPVAPLIFKLQQASTYRFLESSVFDCKSRYCFGVVDRTDMSVTALGGYGDILGMVSYVWRDIRTPRGFGPVAAELEYFSVSEGRHNYGEWNVAVGYMVSEEITAGLQYTSGRISDGDKEFSSLYGVCQWPWLNLDWTAGVGRFSSDEPGITGNGVVLTIGKKFGETLSLF